MHTDRLQALRMASDFQQAHPRRQVGVAIVEDDTVFIDIANQGYDIVDRVGVPHRFETHAAAGRILHFRVLYVRSEEHTSELQSLMRLSYAVFCLPKKTT